MYPLINNNYPWSLIHEWTVRISERNFLRWLCFKGRKLLISLSFHPQFTTSPSISLSLQSKKGILLSALLILFELKILRSRHSTSNRILFDTKWTLFRDFLISLKLHRNPFSIKRKGLLSLLVSVCINPNLESRQRLKFLHFCLLVLFLLLLLQLLFP